MDTLSTDQPNLNDTQCSPFIGEKIRARPIAFSSRRVSLDNHKLTQCNLCHRYNIFVLLVLVSAQNSKCKQYMNQDSFNVGTMTEIIYTFAHT